VPEKEGYAVQMGFVKMHGCGNDYLYVDGISGAAPAPHAAAQAAPRLCARHTGVGADGIILLLPCEGADARMRMFNADGTEGAMCGNGVRCAGALLMARGLTAQSGRAMVRTNSGVRAVARAQGGLYTVEMGAPEWRAEEMGLAGLRGRVLGRPLEFEGESRCVSCVAVGNVHCVQFVPDTAALRLEKLGPRVAYAGWFPSGANAGFAQLCGENELRVRVYERGSKETLACGTGACAAAACAWALGLCARGSTIAVHMPGGTLWVREKAGQLLLTGPVQAVFEGKAEI